MMKTLHSLFAFALAFAISVPGLAQGGPEKLYALKLTSTSATVTGNGLNLEAEFRNISPKNANSSFNATRLAPPLGSNVEFLTVSTANCRLFPTPTGTVKATEIRCENLSPVGKDGFFKIQFTANVPPASCGAQWNPSPDDDVWSGSQVGSGSAFALRISPTGYPTYTASLTSTTPKVNLAVTGSPTSLLAGDPYIVTATVTDACGSSTSTAVNTTGSLNVVLSPSSGSETPFIFTATPGSSGTAKIVVNAPALGVSQSLTFPVFEDGTLACGAEAPLADTLPPEIAVNDPDAATKPGFAKATRGFFNGKGEPCLLVNYDFKNELLLTDKSITHKWDTLANPSAAFYYQLNGQLKTLGTNTFPPAVRPQVSWQFDSSGPINKHDGLACISPSLPRPYGELGTLLANSTGSMTFTLAKPAGTGNLVDGKPYSTPPATPFPIYIGSERMTVTGISGATWTVTRGGVDAAGTPVSEHLPTSVGTPIYVLSTPLPVNAQNTVELICIVSLGWKMYEPGKYFWFLDAIDIGDGWVSTED